MSNALQSKSSDQESQASNLIVEILLIYLIFLGPQPIVVFHKPLTYRQCKHQMKLCLLILEDHHTSTEPCTNLHCMTQI